MKSITLIIFLLNNLILLAQIPEPSGRRLREIVEDIYSDTSAIIGGTTGSWAFGTNTGLILDREFSYVTPENDFKHRLIHPDPTTWSWTQSDIWIQHIVDHNQILRMHCPIGPQCSNWAKADNRTPEELEANLRAFLQALCERYNETAGIEYMDVVNETIIQGAWHTNKPGIVWECPWYKIGQDTNSNITPLYIKYAFEIAQQYAPDTKFIYNQHEGPENGYSWELIFETIAYLRAKQLRVDGIGWQAHVNNGWSTPENLNLLSALIDSAHNNNLEFHITEASVWLPDTSQTLLEEQAATYSAILEILLKKRTTGKVGWNTWHIDDGHGWYKEYFPSLFDADYMAKPAYYAIQEALEDSTVSIGTYFNKTKVSIQFGNYSNPFKNKTKIYFTLPSKLYVKLEIYNLLGEKIETLIDKTMLEGKHIIDWNSGYTGSSKIYICTITTNDFTQSIKLLLK